MHDLEWKEVEPNSRAIEKQVNLTAFYGEMVVGTIVYCGIDLGWQSVINGSEEFLEAETEDAAKAELLESLISHYEGEIEDGKAMLESLKEFNGEEKPKSEYTPEEIQKAIRHFESVRSDAIVVLDSGFGTHPGESDTIYRNRKLHAEIAIKAIQKMYQEK